MRLYKIFYTISSFPAEKIGQKSFANFSPIIASQQ